jgi:membrane fusion protein, multidrug efflux system
MSIVPDEDIWVQANFKETQIGPMQEGQRVELTFDSYPDTPIEARVESLFSRLRRAVQPAAAGQRHR